MEQQRYGVGDSAGQLRTKAISANFD